MTESIGKKKVKEALALFNTIPKPTEAGTPAGSRREGVKWQKAMREILGHSESHFVVTSIGKSSNDEEIDGNAVDRMSYKLVRYARAAAPGTALVVAVNAAFEKFDSPEWAEILAQIDWLRAKASSATIHVLASEA